MSNRTLYYTGHPRFLFQDTPRNKRIIEDCLSLLATHNYQSGVDYIVTDTRLSLRKPDIVNEITQLKGVRYFDGDCDTHEYWQDDALRTPIDHDTREMVRKAFRPSSLVPKHIPIKRLVTDDYRRVMMRNIAHNIRRFMEHGYNYRAIAGAVWFSDFTWRTSAYEPKAEYLRKWFSVDQDRRIAYIASRNDVPTTVASVMLDFMSDDPQLLELGWYAETDELLDAVMEYEFGLTSVRNPVVMHESDEE